MSKLDDKRDIDTTFMTCIVVLTIVGWIVAIGAMLWLYKVFSLLMGIA